MKQPEEKEIHRVLSTCSAAIDQLIEDYKINKKINNFTPLVNVYTIGTFGFFALLSDESNDAIASVLSFEKYIIYTSYFSERVNMN